MGAAVSAACEMSELFLASTDQDLQYFLLLCHVSAEDACVEAMRPFGFSRASVRGWAGTAAENDRMLDGQIEDLEKRIADEKAHLATFAPQRDALRQCLDRSVQDIAREEAAGRLVGTESTFYLQGWIPAPAEANLMNTLSGFTCAWETQTPAPEDYGEVPIQLKSNKLTSPYNMITEMYSLPAYNGLDPNPFIMPFFALFFGIMFADMAYGLIMAIAGIVALKVMKPKGTMKNMMGLLFQCGISTFIIGFLTGGFFGDAVSVVGGIFGKDWTLVPYLGTIHIGSISIDLPLNLLEGNNPLYILILAMILGVIHLAVGVALGTYLNIRDGKWIDAAADVSWWIIFAGIAVMVLNGSMVLLIIGLAVMVISAFLQGKGFGRLTGIFSAVYNGVTGYLGDVLSYSRLMALMLAGSVIASVFNQLGALGGIVLFIPVAIIGHLLNFGLNLIGCFVHTMRLQFLEFFGKWYRDGGRPFQPLNYNTKYVDIKEE
jgi:V/A-type H+-transporting ATPase subunit I